MKPYIIDVIAIQQLSVHRDLGSTTLIIFLIDKFDRTGTPTPRPPPQPRLWCSRNQTEGFGEKIYPDIGYIPSISVGEKQSVSQKLRCVYLLGFGRGWHCLLLLLFFAVTITRREHSYICILACKSTPLEG